MAEERVDILVPPMFHPGGEIKTREQAQNDGDWIATFNLWIVTKLPAPAIIYQRRSLQKSWAPGFLDVAAGGHYMAGEQVADGLREVEEELGKCYKMSALTRLGRKMVVLIDTKDRELHEVSELYLIEDNGPLNTYKLQEEEVDGLFVCPVTELLKVNRDKTYNFTAKGINVQGKEVELAVDRSSFPDNWDDYHYKMAVIAGRYFRGDTDLLY